MTRHAAAAMAAVLGASALLPAMAAGNTYYIRSDGGDAVQCNGTRNAPYSGSGHSQACAWKHPFVALPPARPPRIAGGDTVIVQRGEYAMGWGAPETETCSKTEARACIMASIPGGPSPDRPTRLLGEGFDAACDAPPQLWATEGAWAIVQLEGASNIEIACLELTDRSGCIKGHQRSGTARGETARCEDTAPPYGQWGENGIVASDSRQVLLRDLNIHGMAGNGVRAGRLHDWQLVRVRLHANGWAGWDGNIQSKRHPGSSNSGRIVFSGGEISWNGCGERYPERTIFGCWAQQQGGYGDGLGTAKTGGQWLFEDMHVHHNTSDGLDLLYLDGTGSVTLRRVHAEANAGNQIKTAGPMTIENSVLTGNCAFFADLARADPASSSLAGKDHCRAMGNTLSVSFIDDSHADIRHNTISGQGDCLLVTTGGNRSARALVQNNAFVGGAQWQPDGAIDGERTCGHYAEASPASVVFEHNLFWQVKAGSCPPGNLCDADPKLTRSAGRREPPMPQAGSALLDAAMVIPGLERDFHHRPRGAQPDIGAVEWQATPLPPGRTR